MNEKRYRIVSYMFAFFFVVLLIRIFSIQIIMGPQLAKAASAQRTKSFGIEKDRGNILDRNGIRFTNRSTESKVVLNPMQVNTGSVEFKSLCNLLCLDFATVEEKLEGGWEPVIIDTDSETGKLVSEKGLNGVSVIHTLKRYDENSLAAHVLGYLNGIDDIGETGIEKFYNDVLENGSKSIVVAITDARNNIIEGTGYRILEIKPKTARLNIKLTLDYHIQGIVESVMEENRISGAVVVEDVNNGDIVALASKYDFDQNVVSRYIHSPRNELFNRAVASYNLGSVFKIIDVASMLENGIEDPGTYYCRGYIEIGNIKFKCAAYDRGGHGLVNLDSAFAHSCNAYFINLGIKIGYGNLLRTASVLGLGMPTGIGEQGVNESSGILPALNKYHSYGDIANISIGQGEIMATPIQIADITATIANGGIKNRVNIVDSIVDDDGNIIRKLKVNEGIRVIEKDTADKIKKLMEEVVNSGTGSAIDLVQYGGAAGKTGSAETGQFIDGVNVVHAWFAGYFPRRAPRYSVAVFIENGRYGSKAAAPVFEQIAERVLKAGF
jgi:penicillin-binding protein 2